MATVPILLEKAGLDLFELPFWETRQAVRSLWVTQELIDWVDGTAALHDRQREIGGRTIFEHIESALSDFRCSERPMSGDIALRRLMPTKEGIWSMHGPGVRIYGWCPCKHGLVAVTGALEQDTKTDSELNGAKRDEVLAFIKGKSLDSTILRGDYLAIFPH